MENEHAINTAPDWTTREKDLLCPLCGYNLRGLTESRCPECGFKFTWQELIDAEKDRHMYIFEHGAGNNVKSFWKTYWRTCRPRRFWNDLNPAQPVHVIRLLLYWLIASGLMAGVLSVGRTNEAIHMARLNRLMRASQVSGVGPLSGMVFTPAQMDAVWPLPSQLHFWTNIFFASRGRYYGRNASDFGWAAVFMVWPWLTLIALFVFRYSMREAKIKAVHLLRATLYSCDFGVVLTGVFLAVYFYGLNLADGWLLLIAGAFCSAVTTYRLTIAFRQYLRVHLPFATVLASQFIAFLVLFLLLVQLTDFSRRT